MIHLIIHLLLGFLVGIYGYLFPGLINLQVLDVGISSTRKQGFMIIGIIALVEIPYCLVCMMAYKSLLKIPYLSVILGWLILIMLIGMGIWFYLQAKKITMQSVKEIPKKSISSLLLFAIFNPFQLSAWSIWGAYFIDKSWFEWSLFTIFIFSLGAALGTGAILWMYYWAGLKLVSYYNGHQQKIKYGMAGIMVVLALIQLIKNL